MKNGWEMKKLGDVCSFVRGPFGGSLKKSIFVAEGYAVYEQQHAIYDQFDEVRYFIDETKFKEMKRFEILPGDLIMSCSGTMGRIAIVPSKIKRGIINQALLKLTTSSKIFNVFLKLLMESENFQDALMEYSGGAAIQNVASVNILKEIKIPLPPLPEQKRIVAILDQAFDAIATAKAHAQQNLQNAHAIFESYLNEVFTRRGDGWVERELGDMCHINYGYTESSSFEEIGPKFLRITDIKDNKVDWASVPYCPIEICNYPKYELQEGDIVFARTGATTGKSYLVVDPPESVFASYLIRMRMNVGILDPKFVNMFFQTSSYWENIRSGVSGSAQGGFNAKKLSELIIPFPKSLRLQLSTVETLERIQTETQRLASIYERKIAALDELKRSLLQQAFEGNL